MTLLQTLPAANRFYAAAAAKAGVIPSAVEKSR
jgi:hypothetical protein